jgi:cellulose synthase/poly-beta-1,6-N-acetylglucosamine synthase-like glycosyltransferase
MIYVLYILAMILVWFSYRSFRGGVEYLRYFKQELARPLSEWVPFATVIAPCKGLDEGLKKNLQALLAQDYPAYEVVFVVDDEADPAVSVITEIISRNSTITKLVVASKAVDSSQKVENLREAVLHASASSEVFVFVDSDARPATDWLRHLVAPLADNGAGAATGYRWFISKKPSFSSELRNMWNASIASALGPNTKSNFCWGGSTAIRRETFERLNVREKWKGTLSDDFTVTRVMSEAGLKIYFVPQALTPTVENCSLAEMFEFTNRQMKIEKSSIFRSCVWQA